MRLKAQSASEFLVTYGWALVIMLAVISVLFYLGFFSPKTVAPSSCVFPAGFSCQGYKIEGSPGNEGKLTLILSQNMGHTLSITGINCTEEDSASSFEPVNTRMYDGDSLNITATCYKLDGSTPATDEYYKGTIFLSYLDEDTNMGHSAIGEIAYRVE